MARDLPSDPHDPRWLPSRRMVVLLGVAVQCLVAVFSWALIATYQRPAGPLVAAVLVPEDVVYHDTYRAPQRGRQRPPVDLPAMLAGTDAQRQRGAELFGERCASCHGTAGRGDGQAGVALQPPPRNLTSLEGWQRGPRFSELFTTVSLGLEGTQMPSFDYLDIDERFSLAHFVASLVPGRPLDDRASLDSLEARFALSTGAREPNVIPLNAAMERLAASARAGEALTAERAAAIAKLAPRGAALHDRLVLPDRADRTAALLRADAAWRSSPERLRSLVTCGAPTNGFSTHSALLSRADWSALQEYLALRYQAEP